jgi:hypothetical protein
MPKASGKGLTMNVTYTLKNVYGNDLRYPANDAARLACALANTMSLTDTMVRTLEGYGHTVVKVLS